MVAADLDGDGRIDLFVANDMSANYLFRNLGGFRFEESALVRRRRECRRRLPGRDGRGLRRPRRRRPARPGRDELLQRVDHASSGTSAGASSPTTPRPSVWPAPSRFRLGFGVALPDVNNDGRLDFLTANGHIHDGRPQFPFEMPLQLFLGDEAGRLVDVTARAGARIPAEHIGRGLAVGDLDNDGRIDAVVVAQNEPLVYLHNRTERDGHFVTLQLEGPRVEPGRRRGEVVRSRPAAGAVCRAHGRGELPVGERPAASHRPWGGDRDRRDRGPLALRRLDRHAHARGRHGLPASSKANPPASSGIRRPRRPLRPSKARQGARP